MKKILLSLFATALSVCAQNFAYLPALKPWTLAWDQYDPSENVAAFQLFYGTNAIAILTTNDFSRVGITNGLVTFRAPVPALLAGTNEVRLAAIDLAGQSSPTSLPLTLTILGEPAAPQNLRKP